MAEQGGLDGLSAENGWEPGGEVQIDLAWHGASTGLFGFWSLGWVAQSVGRIKLM